MINQINSITSEEIVGFGDDPVYLANYGVMTNRDGSISVNAATFRKAYEANPDEFNAILNSRVTTGSSLVSALSADQATHREATHLPYRVTPPRSTAMR